MVNRKKLGIIATVFIWGRIETRKFVIMGIASFWTAIAMLVILLAVNHFSSIPVYRWYNIPLLVIYVAIISSFYLFLFPYLQEKNFQLGENLGLITTVGVILALVSTSIPLTSGMEIWSALLVASSLGLLVALIAAIVIVMDLDESGISLFGISLMAAMISGFMAALTSGIIFGLLLFSPIAGLIIGLVSGLITIILAIIPVTLVLLIEKVINLNKRLIEKF